MVTCLFIYLFKLSFGFPITLYFYNYDQEPRSSTPEDDVEMPVFLDEGDFICPTKKVLSCDLDAEEIFVYGIHNMLVIV